LDDLSLHVLDIIENSVAAGATIVEVEITEQIRQNRLIIEINDNGKGMNQEILAKVLDPFYTQKTVRRVGLGLSLLAQAAKEAGGSFDIRSEPGKGTHIKATFVHDHIDRKPLGKMSETICAFIVGSGQKVDLVYRHRKDNAEFVFSTVDVKKMLNGVVINHPEIIAFLKQHIQGGLDEISDSERSRK
jgi:hypothetical protein